VGHADVEVPDAAIVSRLAELLNEARDLADLIAVRPHLSAAAGLWIQQIILGADAAHQQVDGAAIAMDAPMIHRARMLQDYIWTAGGGKFYPQDPRAAEVQVSDIAHALAFKCRWSGHTSRMYSVAEHSLHAADIAAFLAESTEVSVKQVRVYALLHDAHEAYLPDIARPVANYLDGSLDTMAVAVQEAILEHLDLRPASADIEMLVQTADDYALRLESEVLFDGEDQDPDDILRHLGELPPEVRNRFPVQGRAAAPPNWRIRELWGQGVLDAIAEAKEEQPRVTSETTSWRDAQAVVETQDFCVVCSMTAMPGCAPRAVADGLCATCHA